MSALMLPHLPVHLAGGILLAGVGALKPRLQGILAKSLSFEDAGQSMCGKNHRSCLSPLRQGIWSRPRLFAPGELWNPL